MLWGWGARGTRPRRCAITLSLLVVVGGCVEIDPSYANDATGTDTPTTESGDTATGSAGTTIDAGGTTTGGTAPNIAFVTSTRHNGNLGGLSGADDVCNQRAQAAGLPGTYVAYLSDGSTDARDRLGTANGWVRTDGRLFARDRDDLVAGFGAYTLVLDEFGESIFTFGPSFVFAFTGTNAGGTAASEARCNEWSDATGGLVGRAPFVTLPMNHSVASGTAQSCDAMAALYCFGTDNDAPTSVAAAEGSRLAFISSDAFAADAGREAADALCTQEAEFAGITAPVLALLAVPGEPLWDRHEVAGGDWVRADGVTIFSAEDGPSGWDAVDAPLLLNAAGLDAASGPRASVFVGTTSASTPATADSSCDGWTSATTPEPPALGSSAATGPWLTGTQPGTPINPTCAEPHQVLCLEQ
ncbi:MAG: DUF1554 domain-containing protein [Myxococcota bacterium]